MKIRKLKIIILIIIIVHINNDINAQITEKQLNYFFKNEQSEKLHNEFSKMAQKTDSIRQVIENDTIIIISDFVEYLIVGQGGVRDTSYFFLQYNFPKVTIGNKKYEINTPFALKMNYDKLIPLKCDYYTINNINSFFGKNPNDYANVKRYRKSKDFFRKYFFWNARKKINRYNQRTKFIGEFLFLSATWGQIDRSLIPYKITYLKFNKNLNKVEVKYDMVASGGIEIYILKNGNWVLSKTIMRWDD